VRSSRAGCADASPSSAIASSRPVSALLSLPRFPLSLPVRPPWLAQVRKLQQENDDLRGELNSLDPAFFDEIEDLKYNHNEMVSSRSIQTLHRALACGDTYMHRQGERDREIQPAVAVL
jgi:hypothetical protein